MAFTLSPNMNLPVPTVGSEPGPDYALDVNSAFSILDGHNHSAGSGVPVTPDGLSISSDLPFLNNNATNLRSVRFLSQSAALSLPADLQCIYVTGVDMYYNDGNGNQVRITQSGGVAGSPGSISGLSSPASASYVSGSETFVWQSNTNKPANLDGGFIKLRNNSANSKALTLSPPAAMGSDYGITLPSLPGTTNIMSLDASGNMGAAINVDNSTLQLSSNTLAVKAKGITQGLLANRATGSTVAAGGFAISTRLATASGTGDTDWEVITALSVTITTTGRPVKIGLMPVNDDFINISNPTGVVGVENFGTDLNSRVVFGVFNGSDNISYQELTYNNLEASAFTAGMYVPCGCIEIYDLPAAGTYTYTLKAKAVDSVGAPGVSWFVGGVYLYAYEL